MARFKIKNPTITREEAISLTNDVVTHQEKANALRAKMNVGIQSVRDKYEKDIADHDKEVKAKSLMVEAWARSAPEEFETKKSLDLTSAVIGFRTGTPKVVKGKKHSSFAAVAKAMLKISWAKKYIKLKEPDVNKELLIADRKILTADQLNELGLRIEQDEAFYIDPKVEELTQGVTS